MSGQTVGFVMIQHRLLPLNLLGGTQETSVFVGGAEYHVEAGRLTFLSLLASSCRPLILWPTHNMG